MKKLLQMFKGLPPEIRTLVAMAGLASPIGAIYMLKRFLFPSLPIFFVILIVAGVVGAICLIGFLISRMFGRGKRKRTKRMAAELASEDAQGPVSVDVRAAIKSNNEKYFTAIRDMRKNLGISVYDLPWYIVIGDSGCGKTRLINNGGLTFSTGKPEGYQLGTLNYNWWFTEDAVFVDMAGRLCNPQEDADYKEWQAFLETISKGRRGFPINGAIVCVSAEHLLQDSPEKHEADANTVLERLREMQTKLGVTFATYLVITKCDKILGFMQFFDRAERDITIKNQVFGWSKPGNFNDLYDPEQFGGDFEGLYARLNELRMRRMNDDVDEIDLGLAYSLPEEFRELKAPLQTYVRVLFPMIKNPRAIKNLIFRGVYFTSATQEGALILNHMKERLGAEAADQFPTLDTLYPEKRPLFVKDVFFRKVFPEHGLVFRNEQEVVRNRKLAKVLKFGSVALVVVLVAALWWSSAKVRALVVEPQERADEARLTWREPAEALHSVSLLADDVSELRRNRLPAAILSVGIGSSKPIEYLNRIRVRLFEYGVLKPVLRNVDRTLREGNRQMYLGTEEGDAIASRMMDALAEYVTWFGCAGADDPSPPDDLNYESFKRLCTLLADEDTAPLGLNAEDFKREAASYFGTIQDGEWANPARLLKEEEFQPVDTIKLAMAHIHAYLRERYATLGGNSPNADVGEWMRIQNQCAAIESAYGEMVEYDLGSIATTEDVAAFQRTYVDGYEKFTAALEQAKWKLGSGALVEIGSIKPAVLAQRDVWVKYDARLAEAFKKCQLVSDSRVAQVLPSLTKGSAEAKLISLDAVLWDNLRTSGLAENEYREGFFDDPELFDRLVKEVYQAYPHIIKLVEGTPQTGDAIELTDAAKKVRGYLKEIKETVAGTRVEAPDDLSSETVGAWRDELNEYLDDLYEDKDAGSAIADLGSERWRRDDLVALYKDHLNVIRLAVGTQLLNRIAGRLDPVRMGEWGFAELADGWRTPVSSVAYSIRIPAERASESEARPERERARPERTERRRRRERAPVVSRTRRDSSTPPARTRNWRTNLERSGEMPACATPTFLTDRAIDCVGLVSLLRELRPGDYLGGMAGGAPLHQQCVDLVAASWQQYVGTYARMWHAAYSEVSLTELGKLANFDEGWRAFASQFQSDRSRFAANPRKVGDELVPALEEVLHGVRWATYMPEAGAWTEQRNYSREWSDVAAWFNAAVRDAWGSDSFVLTADVGTQWQHQQDPPWTILAQSFGQKWEELATGIGHNVDLRAKLKQTTTRKPKLDKIPWEQLAKHRADTRMTDETLTREVVDFESSAQRLLSEHLTEILCSIQEEHFGTKTASEGWPYVKTVGSATETLETVPFDEFKQFLTRVVSAHQVFEGIEESMPPDAVRDARLQFYAQCRAWYDFLGLQGGGPDGVTAQPLGMEITGGDPKTDPQFKTKVDDTAQYDYQYAELAIGLRTLEESSDATGAPLGAIRLDTHAQRKFTPRKAEWNWEEHTGDDDVTIALVGGKTESMQQTPPQDQRKIIGKETPLVLCAFLEEYGYGNGQNWKALIRFRLEEPQGTKDIGEMFQFTLDRAMPQPIKELQCAGLPTALRD